MRGFVSAVEIDTLSVAAVAAIVAAHSCLEPRNADGFERAHSDFEPGGAGFDRESEGGARHAATQHERCLPEDRRPSSVDGMPRRFIGPGGRAGWAPRAHLHRRTAGETPREA